MKQIPKSHIRKYWFGIESADILADTILLMERDRVEQYKAALDLTLHQFQGVFSGVTGLLDGKKISIVYSISPSHIADCVNFLAYAFDVRRCISTGSIGGLGTEMGDIIVSNICTTQDAYSFAVFPSETRFDQSLGYLVDIKMPESVTVSENTRSKIKAMFDCEIVYGSIFTVPAVSLENESRLNEIEQRGYIALDLETGPFLSSCLHHNIQGLCVHWVTDLPLERNFYYQYEGDKKFIEQDRAKKHKQWLNMPRLILLIVRDLLGK